MGEILSYAGGLIALAVFFAALAIVGFVGVGLRRSFEYARRGYWSIGGGKYLFWSTLGLVVVAGIGVFLYTSVPSAQCLLIYVAGIAVLLVLGWFGVLIVPGGEGMEAALEGVGESQEATTYTHPDGSVKHWRQAGNNQIQCSGAMSLWIRLFELWHSKDKQETRVDFSRYLMALTFAYSGMAKEQWAREPNGKEKIAKLDSFFHASPGGGTSIDVLDAIDFLSQNIPENQMQTWASQCRTKAKEVLRYSR